jgi:hypothetical protein
VIASAHQKKLAEFEAAGIKFPEAQGDSIERAMRAFNREMDFGPIYQDWRAGMTAAAKEIRDDAPCGNGWHEEERMQFVRNPSDSFECAKCGVTQSAHSLASPGCVWEPRLIGKPEQQGDVIVRACKVFGEVSDHQKGLGADRDTCERFGMIAAAKVLLDEVRRKMLKVMEDINV